MMSDLDQIHSLLRKLNSEGNIFRAQQLAREVSWMLQSPAVKAIEAESDIDSTSQGPHQTHP